MDPFSFDDDLGGIQLGYQPEELAKLFFTFVRSHSSVHKELHNFQLTERHLFMGAEEKTALGEGRLEWTDSHQRFCAIIERLMKEFQETDVACSEQEFCGAIEECKCVGSPWWVPVCKLVDSSDYQTFSSMLQNNVCLCCGDPFLAYQSGELLRDFLAYMRRHPEIHTSVRNFQLKQRYRFVGAEQKVDLGEHRLEWSEVHREFVAIIESHINAFIKESSCNEQEFLAAMAACMKGCSSEWPPFAALLDITDYTVFAKMLQNNACLCCGEPFSGYRGEELADELKKYMQGHPVIHEELRVFQTQERQNFIGALERVASGEHCLEWTDVHRRFVALIDVHVKSFLEEIHCSEEEFVQALQQCDKTDATSSLAWFSTLLNTADYTRFAHMLQTNTCFCCGQTFYSDEDLVRMRQASQNVAPAPALAT